MSDVINTIQTFADSIGSIIEAWNAFHRTQISLFTIHAPEKLNWPQLLDNIIRQISELARLRRLLLTQRERFKFKLDSVNIFTLNFPRPEAKVNTASHSLQPQPNRNRKRTSRTSQPTSQNRRISRHRFENPHANDCSKSSLSKQSPLIPILTAQFVAFPLLFTTAFFSMDFVRPPYPGAVFTGVLIFVGFANYMIAMQRSPVQTFKDLVRWIMKWLG